MDLVSPDDALLFGLLVKPGRPLVRDQLEVEAVLCCQLRDRFLLESFILFICFCTGRITARLRENLFDLNDNFFQILHRNRLGRPVTCHVLVQNLYFWKRLGSKSAKSPRNRSNIITLHKCLHKIHWESSTFG